MSIERVVMEADGGSRGNPGPAGYGAVVFDPDSGEVLAERSESIGTATNNVAEYGGLIAGLQAAQELGARQVAVRMDSKLVVEQMKGTWQVKHPGLRELARTAAALRSSFDRISFEWIPRAQNAHADRLANEAMDRAAGKSPRPAKKAAAATDRVRDDAPASTPMWVPPTTTPTRLILVRHGATEHSAQRRFSGRNDLPLDEAGTAQAAALAARDFGEVGAIVSSPIRRAVQTADAIGQANGLPVEVVDGFAEMDFGAWEGRTMAEVEASDATLLQKWLADIAVAPPGGESFAEVERRVRRARDSVLATRTGTTTVVVSHVTPIKTLLRLALDAPPSTLFRIFLDTASVSVVDYYDDGNCSVRGVNDIGHLREVATPRLS